MSMCMLFMAFANSIMLLLAVILSGTAQIPTSGLFITCLQPE